VTIAVFVDGFSLGPATALNGTTTLIDYTVADLVRGAVTIRRDVPAQLRVRSLLDHASAALQILSVMRGGGPLGLFPGPLHTSEMHAALDSTEKGSASYRVGMAVAHLLGQDLLDLREVRHVDPLFAAGDLTLLAGRRRPDLIGLDANDDWSVIEAKGRSDGPDDAVLDNAKEQSENVDLVRNSTGAMISPTCRVRP
jgi:hypothetical protein